MVRVADLESGNYRKNLGMSTVAGADRKIRIQLPEPGEGASTVEIKINYLRAISEGTLWGEGKVIRKGKRIVAGQGEVKNDEGELLALGTATFMVRQMTG